MMQMRTHTCNELRASDAGKSVKIVGWMENVREVGGSLAFVVLRDFYGTTQVVVEDEADLKVIKGLNKESTISVEGTVRERASKNPKLPTGEIEVVPTKIEVLGRCRYNALPFEINRSREADETQRLKYRYLDLRNPAVKQNIILRCQVVAALRAAMMEHGFLEITTPILTASSPEGARDYLVPARKHPGKFYALPQAPQQFKQLLMTSGFDRYFQIAPCFRDEDARGDRSPGEFYQLDMEMAFATQDDIFAVLEDVLPPIFAKFGTYNVASSAPFRRIAYRDAMETYGSDKPDLRIDLTCKNVTSLFAESEFEALRGQTVKMVPVSDCKLTRKQIDKLLGDCEVQSGSKAYWFKMDENGELVLAEGAVRDDGASAAYLPLGYPAVADHRLLECCRTAAAAQGFAHRCGLVRSHDSFYTDEEMEICRTWSARGILGADMETAALYTIGRLRGMAAASILNNVAPYESDVAESVADYADGDRLAMQGEQNEIITALEAFVRWEEQYGSH